jgi:hypothetical protein
MAGKKVPERRSGLHPSEKELPERRSGAFSHKKNTPAFIHLSQPESSRLQLFSTKH